jgi:hypothetical protein
MSVLRFGDEDQTAGGHQRGREHLGHQITDIIRGGLTRTERHRATDTPR